MPARLVVFCAVVALAGCATTPSSTSPVALTGADSGREVTLTTGQRLTVSLEANPTTGYGWALADSVGGALARDGAPVYTRDPSRPAGMPGVGGEVTWTFQAARPGRGTLRLAYGRAWEPGEPAAETFEVPVVVR